MILLQIYKWVEEDYTNLKLSPTSHCCRLWLVSIMSADWKTGEDRISHLPESIQDRILSFLDLKQAVQTSVLSRSWRYVWRQISSVSFNFQFGSYACSCGDDERYRQGCFENFVLNFITCHRGWVRKLYFNSADGKFGAYFVRKIICFAACNDIEDLMLIFYNEDPFDFPTCFYQSRSLRSVTLVHSESTQWTPFTHPFVRSLCLHSDAVLGTERLTGDIILHCPCLEHLSLINFKLKDAKITAPKLKALEIWGDYDNHFFQEPSLTSKVVISTQCLESVKLSAIIPEICLSEDDSQVKKLEITHTSCFPGNKFKKRQICLQKLINLLRLFRGVRSLTMSLGIAEV